MLIIRDKDIINTLTHKLDGQKRQIEFFFKDRNTFDMLTKPMLESDAIKKYGMYYTFIYVPKGCDSFFYFEKSFLKVYDPTKKKLTFGYTVKQLEAVPLSRLSFLKYKFIGLCDY